ncbi:hypothetical protein A1D29_03450 [Pasteurellaceae bacterium Orientalotternb1]|nr:hypothetical protein A1D29_03450 [Pasteurellaceae bacterium Orientalotternb1]
MKNLIKSHSIYVHVFIIVFIILLCPDYATTTFQKDISSFLDSYLFGDIGLVSDNRPFMSKIAGNYVAIVSIAQGILLYWSGSISSENTREISPCSFLGQIIIVSTGFYFTFFSNVILKVPPKSYINISPDSLFIYGISLIACLGISSMGISAILYLLRKTKSFIELIK